jgi:hypothetical protein
VQMFQQENRKRRREGKSAFGFEDLSGSVTGVTDGVSSAKRSTRTNAGLLW